MNARTRNSGAAAGGGGASSSSRSKRTQFSWARTLPPDKPFDIARPIPPPDHKPHIGIFAKTTHKDATFPRTASSQRVSTSSSFVSLNQCDRSAHQLARNINASYSDARSENFYPRASTARTWGEQSMSTRESVGVEHLGWVERALLGEGMDETALEAEQLRASLSPLPFSNQVQRPRPVTSEAPASMIRKKADVRRKAPTRESSYLTESLVTKVRLATAARLISPRTPPTTATTTPTTTALDEYLKRSKGDRHLRPDSTSTVDALVTPRWRELHLPPPGGSEREAAELVQRWEENKYGVATLHAVLNPKLAPPPPEFDFDTAVDNLLFGLSDPQEFVDWMERLPYGDRTEILQQLCTESKGLDRKIHVDKVVVPYEPRPSSSYLAQLGAQEMATSFYRRLEQKAIALLQGLRGLCEDVDTRRLLLLLADQCKRLTNSDNVAAFHFETLSHLTQVVGTTRQAKAGPRFPIKWGITGLCASSGALISSREPTLHDCWEPQVDQLTSQVTNLVCVPLFSPENKVIAVIQLTNKRGGDFTVDDCDVLTTYCLHAQMMVNNSLAKDYEVEQHHETRLLQEGYRLLLDCMTSFHCTIFLDDLWNVVGFHALTLLQAERCILTFLNSNIDSASELSLSPTSDGPVVEEAKTGTATSNRIVARTPFSGFALHKNADPRILTIVPGILSTLSATVADAGSLFVSANVQGEKRFDHTLDRLAKFRSKQLIGMPLRNENGTIVATLEVVNKEIDCDDDNFTKTDEMILRALVKQIEASLIRTQKVDDVLKARPQEMVRASEKLLACAKATKLFAEQVSQPKMLSVMMREAPGVFQVERCVVYLLDVSESALERIGQDGLNDGFDCHRTDGIAGKVSRIGEPLAVHEGAQSEDFVKSIDDQGLSETESILYARMVDPFGKVLGVIGLYNKVDDDPDVVPRFDMTDEVVLQIYITAAIVALTGLRERAVIQESLNEEAKMHSIYGRVLKATLPLNEPQDVNQLSLAVQKESCALVSGHRATLWVLDEQTGILTGQINGREIRVPVSKGLVGWCVLNNKSVNVRNAYEDARFNDSIDSVVGYRTKSVIATPINNPSGQTLGALQVLNKQEGDVKIQAFSPDDVLMIEAYSSLVSVSLERTKDYEKALWDVFGEESGF